MISACVLGIIIFIISIILHALWPDLRELGAIIIGLIAGGAHITISKAAAKFGHEGDGSD